MKYTLRMASFWFVLGAVCLCSAPGLQAQSANASQHKPGISSFTALTGANTGCGYSTGEAPIAPVPSPKGSRRSNGASREPSLVLISGHDSREDRKDSERAEIVGLWKFQFVAEGNSGMPPDGAVIDQGFVTWHRDGTEIMNSGRPPITSNFCMGVWRQTRRGTYKLNHFALSWDTNGTTFVGPANIREEVVLDESEDSYSGIFTIDQYAPDGTTPLAHITGQVTATRIKAD
jgi:hypothetical protein